MKLITRTASALAFTGVLFASAAAFAAPADLIAQTTVSTQQPSTPGQQSFEAGLDAYNLSVANGTNSIGTESDAAPACIASCRPWLNLNQRF